MAAVPRRLGRADRNILERDVWLVDGGRGCFLTSILTPSEAGASDLIRFDEGCMSPADTHCGEGRRVILRLLANRGRAVEWVPGRAVVIDNWRTLHARDQAKNLNEERVLERVLVSQS